MVLAADGNDFKKDELDPILGAVQKPILGGTFPSLIHGGETHEKGIIIVGLQSAINVAVIEGLNDFEADYADLIEDAFPEDEDLSPTTLVFVDGFARRIAAFIDGIFNVFGLETNYVGGGAGSLSMQQKPCVITNQGLLQDAAVVGLLNVPSGLGVNHGWESVADPF
ncbi:MAG: FIST N-terminal domain-containing protein [Bacteroidota bacterium]